MSANLLALDDPKIQWIEAKSRNGAAYKTGTIPTKGVDQVKGGAAGRGLKAEKPSKEDFGVDVNWPVDGKWYQTSSDFKSLTGITNYMVSKNDSFIAIFDYVISFKTDESYDYHFEDETGDRYECNVYLTSTTHYISYNSKKPTIINITGK
ncbi:hypothetical protein M413DRAFT_449695 [Hebeloma cylindrosporum]|uniref:Uncharacterized protein n=1 Tax=Hebeloma cylindrosporum TaxID=76867 RepID=A0A0C3BTZ4_HEBCY|nr:hypothetical protein M413DRAFT_449695 [Hebeloma cylindrosporum h7]